MRSFEQCRTEIFRRGEEKRRAEKRMRIKILCVCIPMVICVSLFLLLRLSDPANRMYDKSSVLVYTDTGYCTAAKPLNKGHITELLERITADPESEPEQVLPDAFMSESKDFTPQNSSAVYTIILKESEKKYTLAGNSLTDHSTQRTHILSDDVLRELKTALNISEKE